jgi:hypothetical protein
MEEIYMSTISKPHVIVGRRNGKSVTICPLSFEGQAEAAEVLNTMLPILDPALEYSVEEQTGRELNMEKLIYRAFAVLLVLSAIIGYVIWHLIAKYW